MANTGGGGGTWEVTAQREDFQTGRNGQLVEGTVVTFRTTSGAIGSVFVEKPEYTLERVRGLVDAKAREMDAVQTLRG